MKTSIFKIYLNKRNEKATPDLWAKCPFAQNLLLKILGRFCSGLCFLPLWIPWRVCMENLGWALPVLHLCKADWPIPLGNLEDKERLT